MFLNLPWTTAVLHQGSSVCVRSFFFLLVLVGAGIGGATGREPSVRIKLSPKAGLLRVLQRVHHRGELRLRYGNAVRNGKSIFQVVQTLMAANSCMAAFAALVAIRRSTFDARNSTDDMIGFAGLVERNRLVKQQYQIVVSILQVGILDARS